MILLFPDLDTLRLALTSSAVPADVTLAPAAVSFDDQGRVYVSPAAPLSKATEKILTRLGVKGSKRHGSEARREVSSWVQILPLTREPGTPNLASQTVVLFELTAPDDLPKLVAEMLRLGNDRQGVRWFTAAGDGGQRVLLRVIGPPYYTLLRALDPAASGAAGAVRAYLERAPGLWVEIGHAHPLAGRVRLSEGQVALVRAPREWVFLDDAPFQDVYDILEFPLPAGAVEWSGTEAPDRITVPLRLTAGNAADVAELWVLRDDAISQLDTLVRDADDRLTQRLMFAVATDAQGTRTVVLRTRPSKLDPPVLSLETAVGFKPLKLPNLYLPVGKRLHPTLRRDAVRKLLADDPDQIVWLYPDGTGGFTPETVPDAAFRPLDAWVDYVIETEQTPLATWIGATRFDFDQFVCKDGGGPNPKPDGGEKIPRGETGALLEGPVAAPAARTPSETKSKPSRATEPAKLVTPGPKPVAEWKLRLKALEDRFMGVDGPLDAPERRTMWAELAAATANAGGTPGETAICWLNALWDTDPLPADWLSDWVRNEVPESGETFGADEFDRRLKNANPAAGEQRAVVAAFLHTAAASPPPRWLTARLPAVPQYLEKHEASLPVRAVWLTAFRLAQLSGADVLGLARVRDRLLQRLLNEGMNAERDLPGFLRYAGLRDAERLRAAREKANELHQAVRGWVERHAKKAPGRAQHDDPILRNLPYVDLLFAFAYAKLGEATTARRLADDAGRDLDKPLPAKMEFNQFDAIVSCLVDSILYKGFRHRVEEALLGLPHAGRLPAGLLDELEEIRKKAREKNLALAGPNQQQRINPYWQTEVVVDRMRRESRILEPHEAPEPLGAILRFDDPVRSELIQLESVTDPAVLVNRVRHLYKQSIAGPDPRASQCLVLHKALSLAPRAGDQFAVELLQLVPAALKPNLMKVANPPTNAEVVRVRGELVERSIFLAAHYGRVDLVQQFVNHFIELVRTEPDETRFGLINVVAGQCLRSLRKLGLRDEIDRLLSQIWAVVLQGATIPDLRKKYTARTTPPAWAAVLETLTNLAAGWMTFGLHDRAWPILDEVRAELLRADKSPFTAQAYTDLTRAYIRAIGSGPSDAGTGRILELVRKMPADRVTNNYTTSRHYSRMHLNLVEEVVIALVGDDFALGPAGRRWLEDDEYLVRRRVHADMRRHLDRSGL